jgi:hypothetical protein
MSLAVPFTRSGNFCSMASGGRSPAAAYMKYNWWQIIICNIGTSPISAPGSLGMAPAYSQRCRMCNAAHSTIIARTSPAAIFTKYSRSRGRRNKSDCRNVIHPVAVISSTMTASPSARSYRKINHGDYKTRADPCKCSNPQRNNEFETGHPLNKSFNNCLKLNRKNSSSLCTQ